MCRITDKCVKKGSIVKTALLTAIRTIELQEMAEPEITAPLDVKLRVLTVGVCGSDMHYYREGRIGDQIVEFPWALGHELSAIVEQTGDQVTRVKVGDMVAVDPLVWCGKCDQCKAGRVYTCRDQVFMGCPGQLGGAVSQYVVLPEACCYRVPDGMTADQAAMAEPLSIAIWAVKLAGDIAGKSIAILGSGPIGLSVMMVAKCAGAGKVYMTDIRDYRCELATRLGADWTGNPETFDIVAAINTAELLGVDIAFECAGEQSTIDQAVELIAPAGQIVLVGIPELDRLSFDMNLMRRKEIRVQNVRRQSHCVDEAIEIIRSKMIDVDGLISHHFPIERSADAFEIVADYKDNVVKAMIDVNQRETR